VNASTSIEGNAMRAGRGDLGEQALDLGDPDGAGRVLDGRAGWERRQQQIGDERPHGLSWFVLRKL
jgi:hypothetical protein